MSLATAAPAAALDALNWRLRAVCANHPDPDLWFPSCNGGGEARELCTGCPVRRECLEDVMSARTLPIEGVWAGYNATELAALYEMRHGRPANVRPCGTCTVTFAPRNPAQRYCSTPCARSAALERERQARQRRRMSGQPDDRRAYADNRANHRGGAAKKPAA